MKKLLTPEFLKTYISLLDIAIPALFEEIKQQEWTAKNFTFYTAVSVMSSSKIEGETLEVDSYVKHKMLDVEYLPDLTEKPNDLFKAYEFARDNPLTKDNLLLSHSITTENLLPANRRGQIRKGSMLIMEQQTNRIKYEAAPSGIVQQEFAGFWSELDNLLKKELPVEDVFYFASLIHLVFVKIHPFEDGNGRTARLLEKWFLTSKLGEKAWYIGSEYYYYQHLQAYYNNLARVGLFYDDLKYDKALPFLLMLPNALNIRRN